MSLRLLSSVSRLEEANLNDMWVTLVGAIE